jgi:hypothetical protein
MGAAGYVRYVECRPLTAAVIEAHAAAIAAPGGALDLAAGAAIGATALGTRAGSTAPGWRVLVTRGDLVAGRQARLARLAATVLEPTATPSQSRATTRSRRGGPGRCVSPAGG